MKKFLITLTALSLLLSSCGTDMTDSKDTGKETDTTTLGDTDGDGLIEDIADGVDDLIDDIFDDTADSTSRDTGTAGNGSGNSSHGNMNGAESADPNGGETNGTGSGNTGSAAGNSGSGTGASGSGGSGATGGSGASGVIGGSSGSGGGSMSSPVGVSSAEDAIDFINTKVYSLCREALPMMTETKALSLDASEVVKFNTGLSSTDGINDIILSESMIGSFPYSFVMLRTDGRTTEELAYSLGESVNPSKWEGVSADKISSVIADHDIFLVMGSRDQVDTVMNAVTKAAEGVYESIGNVVSVIG